MLLPSWILRGLTGMCSLLCFGTNSNSESPLMCEVPAAQQGGASGTSGSSLGSSITACKKVTLSDTTFCFLIELEHYFSLTFQALFLKQKQQNKQQNTPQLFAITPSDIKKCNSWKWSENSSSSERCVLKIIRVQGHGTSIPTSS